MLEHSMIRTMAHVRACIDTALDAAEASKNSYGRSYLHVSVEKLDVAADFLHRAIKYAKK